MAPSSPLPPHYLSSDLTPVSVVSSALILVPADSLALIPVLHHLPAAAIPPPKEQQLELVGAFSHAPSFPFMIVPEEDQPLIKTMDILIFYFDTCAFRW
jgi:hypothetical protein